ncbi:MAG: hypothetical protein H6502_00965 [Candidatus Woesearchaeota archaeon]|nr:MAG: hypothetical protein H6502_00965 [Candidatus Woesearchaeota archaeon]
MAHRCISCGKIYKDGSDEILKGCSCGSKLFFYVKNEKVSTPEIREIVKLSKKDRDQIERDIFEIIGVNREEEQPVVLDLESIKIKRPGKYELDLVNLFKKKHPLVYKLEDGKYMIDIIESFEKMRTNDEEEKS